MEERSDIVRLPGESTEPSLGLPAQTPSDGVAGAVPGADAAGATEPDSPRPRTVRRWWLAALLSLLAPPAGQVYNGQIRKGVVLVLSAYLVGFVFAVTALFHLPFSVTILLFALTIAPQIYLVVDAIVQAIRIGSNYRPRNYNRWFVFLPLVAILFVAPRLWLRGVNQFVQTFYIPSESSEPTILKGDHLFADRWSFRSEHPKRGALVIFRSPEDPVDLIKRVVALGGDRVEIRGKQLLLNGRALAEPYVEHTDPRTIPAGTGALSLRDNLAPQIVPAGFVFVLGDNRDNSWDSRFFGPIRQDAIIGGGRLRVYWSWDARRHATRWERTGLFLE